MNLWRLSRCLSKLSFWWVLEFSRSLALSHSFLLFSYHVALLQNFVLLGLKCIEKVHRLLEIFSKVSSAYPYIYELECSCTHTYTNIYIYCSRLHKCNDCHDVVHTKRFSMTRCNFGAQWTSFYIYRLRLQTLRLVRLLLWQQL